GGRVTVEDVGTAPTGTSPMAPAREETRQPVSRMRRAIGQAMTRSMREQPQFSVSRDVDMSAANEKRKEAGASYTDAIVAACAKALVDHPRLRSRIEGDALVTVTSVHVGLAVALDDGLLVPVIRNADRKGLKELAIERERLEEHAHAAKLAEQELTGAVCTISNLGTLGVDQFSAIVNTPDVALLAAGGGSERVMA